jgi:hypothetical protein
MEKKQLREHRELENAEARAERSILLLARKMVPHFQKISLGKRWGLVRKIETELTEYGAYY